LKRLIIPKRTLLCVVLILLGLGLLAGCSLFESKKEPTPTPVSRTGEGRVTAIPFAGAQPAPRPTSAISVGGKNYIHEPFARGACNVCHNVDDVRNPMALKTERSELCAICHTSVKEQEQFVVLHAPFKNRDCTTCHDPHASDRVFLLRADPNLLCQACHGPQVQPTPEARQHTPFAEGQCIACHRPHGSPNEKLLTAPPSLLCVACHAAPGAKEARVPHFPVANGFCDGCHTGHSSVNTPLLRKAEADVCFGCHNTLKPTVPPVSIHPPFGAGECSGCHKPHGADYKWLLRAEPPALCVACHSQQMDELNAAIVHPPFKNGLCTSCHSPHTAAIQRLLLTGVPQLCIQCHSGPAEQFATLSPHASTANMGTRAATLCTTCHSPHAAVDTPMLKLPLPNVCTRCHDRPAHGTHPIFRPADPQNDRPKVDCKSCHQAHGSENKHALREAGDKLCLICHEM